MKYIRLFENERTHSLLKVGDYVKVYTDEKLYGYYEPEKINNIVNNTIGRIKSFERVAGADIIVEFPRGLPYSSSLIRRFTMKNIIEYASTKEELEVKLAAKQYNL